MLTCQELAAEIGVAPEVLRKWVADRGFPVAVKREGRLMFERPVALEWVAKNCIKSSTYRVRALTSVQ